MAENTKIGYVDHTFSPWSGCQAVSPGCEHCFAEAQEQRYGHADRWGPHGVRVRTSPAYWVKPIKWHDIARGRGRHYNVLCATLCDVFDNRAPPGARADLWKLMLRTPWVRWFVLTKRPQNMAAELPADWGDGYVNVALGVTAESQAEAGRRIPILQDTPAALRWISVEPQLEAVEPNLAGISWVICGNESGPTPRPWQHDWGRRLMRHTHAAGAAFFQKQICDAAGRETAIDTWPEDLRVQQFPVWPGSKGHQHSSGVLL